MTKQHLNYVVGQRNLIIIMTTYGKKLIIMYSLEHILYLKKIKKQKFFIHLWQLIIILLFLLIWELLSRNEIINPFLYSSPTKIINTIYNLFVTNNLFSHIWITIYETLISFFIASLLGFIVATLFWWNKFIYKIFEPYLTILNSLPKVALGPLIIIWVGASVNSIILMALMISTFISIINLYNGFNSIDNNYISLMKSMNATKFQIYVKVIIPSNISNIISAFKINISMALIGVIMGELLVSKSGLGYLIMYGSQIFNINLTLTATFMLGIISYLMYLVVNKIDIMIQKKQS